MGVIGITSPTQSGGSSTFKSISRDYFYKNIRKEGIERAPGVGLYEPRYNLIHRKRGADLKIRHPDEMHLLRVEQMKRDLFERQHPYTDCSHLLKAYDDQRIQSCKTYYLENMRGKNSLVNPQTIV